MAYGIWHKIISVIFHVSDNGGMWKDGTTDDIKLICDENNQCKLDDKTKIKPKNNDTSLMFEKWQCNDDKVVIAEDGTVTTENSCTIYPSWITIKVMADTNHTLISGDGDTDDDYTKLYYYLSGNNGKNYSEDVTFEEVALDEGMLKIQFTEIQTTTEDGKNVKIIKVKENDLNKDRYYRFRAKYNVYGTYSETIEIRQVGKEQIILPAFDYLTFTYNWSDSDGRDLDSATTIRNSHLPITNNTTLDDYYVGYGGNGNFNDKVKSYIQHGGDNMSSGDEGALVNWKTILSKDYITEGITTLYCDIYANWFASKKNGNMSVTFNTYKGDTGMEKDGYTFKPKDGTTLVTTKTISDLNVNAYSTHNASRGINVMKTLYSKVATLEYDIKSKTAILYGVYEQSGRDLNNFSVTIDGNTYSSATTVTKKENITKYANSGNYTISKLSYTENNVKKTLLHNDNNVSIRQRYYIEKDGKMTSVSDADWCTVNYTFGSDGSINVSYSLTENTDGAKRECDIVFAVKDAEKANYIKLNYDYELYQLGE